MTIKKRSEIDSKFKWSIEDMYADTAAWEKDYEKALKLADGYSKHMGHLADSGAQLLAAFRDADNLWRITENVYAYAFMKRDEDTAEPRSQALMIKAQTLFSKVSEAGSFFNPEFLSIPASRLAALRQEASGLKKYDYAITLLLREKRHVLTKKEEKLMAQLSEIFETSDDVFSMLTDADLKFGNVKDEKGAAIELTDGNYVTLMRSQDRNVRKNAFNMMYKTYGSVRNTLATSYAYRVRTDAILAKARGYRNSLDKALAPDNVPSAVYKNLIAAVNEAIPVLHRYLDVKKRALGLAKLHMYDVYTPLFKLPKDKYSFAQAIDLVCEGLAPLGSDYIAKLKAGVDDGWIDVYENAGKRSGAYSSGSYDSKPYILTNFQGKLDDVFTLAHELGHSMHSFYTRAKQPFRYGNYSIFTAEVASTVNESLLSTHLLNTMTKPTEQKYLIGQLLEDFRATLFRQTMFAEFELETHKAAERGDALTYEYLSEIYGELNKKYFGPAVVQDDGIEREWSRIPHFYMNFYVYKYATGHSAATALSSRMLDKGEPAVRDYLKFLTLGGSDDPIRLLKVAGVDMSTVKPVKEALGVFESLVDKLDALV